MGRSESEIENSLPLSTGTMQFHCPGEATPVSEAVHLQRLRSGFGKCADCLHNTSGNKAASDWSVRSVRRSKSGVRGQYLNALDRSRAGQIAAIVAAHLLNQAAEFSIDGGEADTGLKPLEALSIAVGFDSRESSPDIFAGVLDALRKSGCNVIDAGRCTAASLLFCCQKFSEASAAMLVTGAGGQDGDTGIDFFLSNGQELSVPWQDFGISIRRDRLRGESHEATGANSLLRRAIELMSEYDAPEESTAFFETDARLVFPGSDRTGGDGFRSGRRSGVVKHVATESYYRQWLQEWWPVNSRNSVRVLVGEAQSMDRLSWLSKENDLALQVGRYTNVSQEPTESDSRRQPLVQFRLDGDDRFLFVKNRRGRELSNVELAEWLNRTDRLRKTQVTAHASESDGRLLLVDVAAPDSGSQYRVISDGLAVLGFILTLMDEGRNSLPG